MTAQPIPEELRKRIQKDWRPVRPLPPPWLRTLPVAALAVLVAAASLSIIRPHTTVASFPLWLSWGGSMVELGCGLVMVGLALRESIPGRRLAAGTTALLVLGGIAVQGLLGLATWVQNPDSGGSVGFLENGIGCLAHDTVLALPTLAITMWLVLRALPTRAPIAGMVGGAGAGLTADAITHLQCPLSDPRHVLMWHTGALLVIMFIGWLIGTLWERRR